MNIVEIFKALGDENRIRILNLLLHKELCVCEIEGILNISQSNASRHLNKLKAAGLIEASKNAQWVFYKASDFLVSHNELLYQYLMEEIQKNPDCASELERLTSEGNQQGICAPMATQSI